MLIGIKLVEPERSRQIAYGRSGWARPAGNISSPISLTAFQSYSHSHLQHKLSPCLQKKRKWVC